MALIADSGGIYGLYDAGDRRHKAIRAAFDAEPGLVVIPTPVLSEIDYLVRTKLGIKAELNFIQDICSGVFTWSLVCRKTWNAPEASSNRSGPRFSRRLRNCLRRTACHPAHFDR